MRSFFALSVPEVSRAPLSRAAKRYQALLTTEPLRWVPVENYHLTLAFLGEIPHQDVPRLHTVASKAADHLPMTGLHLTEVAWFPNALKPKVLAALIKPNKELTDLQKSLLQQLRQHGYRVEGRSFHPHITLARAGRSLQACQLPDNNLDIPLPVDELILFSSQLQPDGPVYSPLFEIPLGT